jgi:hypothetical protein
MKLNIALRGGLAFVCGGVELVEETKFQCTEVIEMGSIGCVVGLEPTKLQIDVAQITSIFADGEKIYDAKVNLWHCSSAAVELAAQTIYKAITE